MCYLWRVHCSIAAEHANLGHGRKSSAPSPLFTPYSTASILMSGDQPTHGGQAWQGFLQQGRGHRVTQFWLGLVPRQGKGLCSVEGVRHKGYLRETGTRGLSPRLSGAVPRGALVVLELALSRGASLGMAWPQKNR